MQNLGEDPRLIIESIFGLGKKQLIGRLDTKLAHVDYNLDKATCDPLARIWRGALYLWDFATGKMCTRLRSRSAEDCAPHERDKHGRD